jgi:hypothetical protein
MNHHFPLLSRVSAVLFLVAALVGCAPQEAAELPGASEAGDVEHVSSAVTISAQTPNGKRVLFDASHEQTAGAADWVIDGAFSDFGNALAGRGYQVSDLRLARPMTLADLSGFDVFVIPEANVPFKTTEQQALLDYVSQGGSVFFIADHYNADRNLNRWDSGEVFNGYRRGAFGNPTKGMSTGEVASAAMQSVTSTDWLATHFGVRFRYNAIGDVSATDVVTGTQALGITAGVTSVAMHAGATVAIVDPSKAKGIVYLPATTAKWASAVDQGVYNGGGRAEGPFVAVGKVSLGKTAFIGDSSPVEDASPKYKREDTGGTKTTYGGWQEASDATLLVQLVDWLGTHESYTSLAQVSGLTLDTPTALLAMETPASSTEPQAEPWSTPAAGYLWYDSSTFKAGSYVPPGGGGGGSGGGTGGGTGGGAGGGSGTSAIAESFDTGSKTAYTAGSVTLTSGSWTLADALLASSSSDRFVGVQAARVRNTGTVTMNFDLSSGAGTVTVKHAVYGTDGSSSWGVWYSTNSGSSWTQAGSAVTTSSTTLATASFSVNVTGPVRLQLRKSSGGANRLNFDDLSVTAAAPAVTVSVSPAAVTLAASATRQFTATVGGSSNPAVTWTATSGSITSGGLYAAPASPGVATVTARSVADTSVIGTATVTIQAAAPTTLQEAFDTGTKTAYSAGSVSLASGSWTLSDALLGSSSSDRFVGAQAVRLRNTGTVTMGFDLGSGAGTVTVKHAVYGADGSSSWGVWSSIDGGSTWAQAGSTVTTSSTVLSTASFVVNRSGAVRLQLRKTSGGSSRLNLDELTVTSY